MPPITPDELDRNNRLRARLNAILAAHPERRKALVKAFATPTLMARMLSGNQNLRGEAAIAKVERAADRLEEAMAGLPPSPVPVPVPVPEPGPSHLTMEETRALTEELRAHVRDKYGGVWRQLRHETGLLDTTVQNAIRYDRPFTATLAARIRAAIDGRPVPPARKLAPRRRKASKRHEHHGHEHHGHEHGPAPEPPAADSDALRLDAQHVIATRFAGHTPGLARELGVTAAAVSNLVEGREVPSAALAKIAAKLPALAHRPMPVPSLPTAGWAQPAAPAPAAIVEAARALVGQWGGSAVAFILQLAQLSDTPGKG